MAIYHLTVKAIGRAAGRSAVGAAAYRSGQYIVDERTGEIHDYRRKKGIVHSELILPGGGTDDRAEFWNRVEKHHKRGDAVLTREVEFALPHELTAEQRQQLASELNRELADKYGVAADLNIHPPHRNKKESKNHHGHILLSACYTAADGTLGKKAVELDPIHCQRHKLENMADFVRVRWAELANHALEKAGHDVRIDHRSYEAQGIDKVPQLHLGPAATAMERRGIQTELGNYNRNVIELAAFRENRKQINLEEREVAGEIKRLTAQIIDLQAKRQQREQQMAQVDVSRPVVRVANGQSEAEAVVRESSDPPQSKKFLAGHVLKMLDKQYADNSISQPNIFLRMYLKRLQLDDDTELPTTDDGRLDRERIKELSRAMRQRDSRGKGGR